MTRTCNDFHQVHIARFLTDASGNGAFLSQCNNGMGLCEKGDDTKTFPEMFLSEGDATCVISVVGVGRKPPAIAIRPPR